VLGADRLRPMVAGYCVARGLGEGPVGTSRGIRIARVFAGEAG